MPRKASDETITHRFELGLTERKQLNDIATKVNRSRTLSTISNTITGVATAAGGVGFLLAGLALSAYLAPKVIKETFNNTKNTIDRITDTILAPINDPIVDTLKSDYETAYRTVNKYSSEVNQFCTPSSIDYDAQKCAIAENNLELAQQYLQDNKDRFESLMEEFKDLSIFDYANPISTFLGIASRAKIEEPNYEEYTTIFRFPTGQRLVDTDGDGKGDKLLWS